MINYDWNETANAFAHQMWQYRAVLKRGAVPFQFFDATTHPSRLVEEGPLVFGVFGTAGSDAQSGSVQTCLELDEIRRRLKDEPLEELGIGTSADGLTWALLVAADQYRYHTKVGKEFHKELLRIFLEGVAWEAWRSVNAPTAESYASHGPG